MGTKKINIFIHEMPLFNGKEQGTRHALLLLSVSQSSKSLSCLESCKRSDFDFFFFQDTLLPGLVSTHPRCCEHRRQLSTTSSIITCCCSLAVPLWDHGDRKLWRYLLLHLLLLPPLLLRVSHRDRLA